MRFHCSSILERILPFANMWDVNHPGPLAMHAKLQGSHPGHRAAVTMTNEPSNHRPTSHFEVARTKEPSWLRWIPLVLPYSHSNKLLGRINHHFTFPTVTTSTSFFTIETTAHKYWMVATQQLNQKFYSMRITLNVSHWFPLSNGHSWKIQTKPSIGSSLLALILLPPAQLAHLYIRSRVMTTGAIHSDCMLKK